MDTIGERLKSERERLKLSQPEFAQLGGVGKLSQIRYESGERSPDGNYLSLLSNHGVDIVYVLTGVRTPPAIRQAQAFRRQNGQIFAMADQAEVLQKLAAQLDEAEDDFVSIPVHDAFLAAGDGCENLTEDQIGQLAFRRDWLARIGVSPQNAVLARAHGDSMQPAIHSGDMLLIDRSKVDVAISQRSEKDTRPSPIYAILDDGQARVKRIERVSEDQLLLLSDNPEHGPQLVKIEKLSILGKVAWWGHTVRD